MSCFHGRCSLLRQTGSASGRLSKLPFSTSWLHRNRAMVLPCGGGGGDFVQHAKTTRPWKSAASYLTMIWNLFSRTLPPKGNCEFVFVLLVLHASRIEIHTTLVYGILVLYESSLVYCGYITTCFRPCAVPIDLYSRFGSRYLLWVSYLPHSTGFTNKGSMSGCIGSHDQYS
jgi:hypothetical protein